MEKHQRVQDVFVWFNSFLSHLIEELHCIVDVLVNVFFLNVPLRRSASIRPDQTIVAVFIETEPAETHVLQRVVGCLNVADFRTCSEYRHKCVRIWLNLFQLHFLPVLHS